MDELLGHYTQRNRLDTKGQILSDSTYLRHLDRIQGDGWHGGREGQGAGVTASQCLTGQSFSLGRWEVLRRTVGMAARQRDAPDAARPCARRWCRVGFVKCLSPQVNTATRALRAAARAESRVPKTERISRDWEAVTNGHPNVCF